MLCPRCHAKWDHEKKACLRCGLALHIEQSELKGVDQMQPSLWERPAAAVPREQGARVLQGGRAAAAPETPLPPSAFVDALPPLGPTLAEHGRRAAPDHAREEPRRSRLQSEARARPAGGRPPSWGGSPASADGGLKALRPGELLQSGRYRLSERLARHEWQAGACETFWLAQDARRGGALVRICEFVIPRSDALLRYSLVRSATIALHAAGRHTQVPTLLDVFYDHERSFFVFEHIEGESLLTRMRRRGHPLSEREVIECCLQMVDVLEFMASQTPPVVHGLIRPDYIIAGRTRSHYYLTGFSVVLASGATQFTAGMARSQLSPYTAPEFAHGVIESGSDIYALLASAYHLLTGSPPTRTHGRILPARQLNPAVSPALEAVLARGLSSGQGLRPDLSQRYRHPEQLRQALSEREIVSGTLEHTTAAALSSSAPSSPAPATPPPQPSVLQTPASAAVGLSPSLSGLLQDHPILQSLAPAELVEREATLLPAPEDLPPLPDSHDHLHALAWTLTLFLSLILTIALARGWF